MATKKPAGPQSALSDDIDRAVEELFGAYEAPKADAQAQAPTPVPEPELSLEPEIELEMPASPPPPPKPAPAAARPAPAAPVATKKPAGPQSALSDDIDRAVEELFGAYEAPKAGGALEPAPGPTFAPEPELAPEPTLALEPEIELEMTPEPEPTLVIEEPQQDEIPSIPTGPDPWETFEQAALTIEWDVTRHNVNAAQRALSELTGRFRLNSDKDTSQIVAMMEQILNALLQSPESVHTTGPQALKLAGEALKASITEPGSASPQLSKARNALNSAMPAGTALPEVPKISAHDSPAAGTLQSHLNFLMRCIKNIQSFEQLFAQKPAFSKVLAIETKLRKSLEGQQKQIADLLNDLRATDAQTLSSAAAAILGQHLGKLEQCGSLVGPIEKLFAKNAAHQKIHKAHLALQNALDGQIRQLNDLLPVADEISLEPASAADEIFIEPAGEEEAIPSLFSLNAEPEMAAGAEGPDVPAMAGIDAVGGAESSYGDSGQVTAGAGELAEAIGAHISSLDQCRNYLLPLENLFTKPGQEKIHTLLARVGAELDNQAAWLSRVVTGDYDSPPETVLQAARASSPAGRRSSCPWSTLLIGEWLGKTVAFVPGEVAYEVRAKGWMKSEYRKAVSFQLKRIKRHFWSKLGPMFKGEMQFLGETYLKHMDVPYLNHVSPMRSTKKPARKAVLLLLFQEGYSGAVLLDGPTTTLQVTPALPWEPINQRGSLLAGHLTIKDKSVPVLTLSRIE